MRNVELTKQRILDAATREFSEHGFAGARVDRIASHASANKSSIYSYFGNKEKLFEAVYREIMRQVVQDVPLDGADLPGYLGRRLEWQFRNPALARISTWGALELAGFPDGAASQSVRAQKIEQIARAQRDGMIGDAFSPEQILSLIDALARPQFAIRGDAVVSEEAFQAYKTTATDALRILLAAG